MPLNIYLFANSWAGVFIDSGSWGTSTLALVAKGTVLFKRVVMKMGQIFIKFLCWKK